MTTCTTCGEELRATCGVCGKQVALDRGRLAAHERMVVHPSHVTWGSCPGPEKQRP